MYWSNEEHGRFEHAMRLHGESGKDGKPDLKKIATLVGTRNPVQVRTHLHKLQKRAAAKNGAAAAAPPPDARGAGGAEGGVQQQTLQKR